MSQSGDDILEDDGIFAGYVDSGVWELERWLDQKNTLRTHFELSQDNVGDE